MPWVARNAMQEQEEQEKVSQYCHVQTTAQHGGAHQVATRVRDVQNDIRKICQLRMELDMGRPVPEMAMATEPEQL